MNPMSCKSTPKATFRIQGFDSLFSWAMSALSAAKTVADNREAKKNSARMILEFIKRDGNTIKFFCKCLAQFDAVVSKQQKPNLRQIATAAGTSALAASLRRRRSARTSC